jgi:hypothetical protein
MGHHQMRDLFHRGFFIDADNFFAHDRFYVFAFFGNDIGLGNNADDFALLIVDGRAANLVFNQRVRQLLDGHARHHRNHIPGHDIPGKHWFPPGIAD